MKLVKNNRLKLVLEVVCEVDASVESYYDSIAADKKIELEYRELKPEHQLTDDQLERYVNFIRSAVSIIYNFNFDVAEQHQSNDSYSYYVTFTPDTYDGFTYVDELGRIIELQVVFRLSDHPQKLDISTPTHRFKEGSGSFFKSFIVAGVRKSNILEALTEIKEICKDLKVGDYSRLM